MNIEYKISNQINFNHVIEKTERFTFPNIRKKTRAMSIAEPYTGVWATENNVLLGLILADNKNKTTSELFSFFVVPEVRNKGIGTQLIVHLESALKKQGKKVIQGLYQDDWKSFEVIEKLLKTNNWESPILVNTVAEIDLDKYTVVDWPELKLSSKYHFQEFKTLNEQQITSLKKSLQEGEIPNMFNPFQHQDRIFHPGSLFLMENERILGWNIVYIQSDTVLENNNLFVFPAYQNSGLAINLLKASFEFQYKSDFTKGSWLIHSGNSSMSRIEERIAKKHLNKLVNVKASRKIFD